MVEIWEKKSDSTLLSFTMTINWIRIFTFGSITIKPAATDFPPSSCVVYLGLFSLVSSLKNDVLTVTISDHTSVNSTALSDPVLSILLDLPIPPPVVQFTHIVLTTHCAPCQDMPSFQLSENELVGANIPFYACQTVLLLAFFYIFN